MNNTKDRATAFLMLLPSLLLLAVFVYFFIGKAVQTSMTDWGEDPDKPALAENIDKDFVGLENYESLMTDFVQSNFRVSLVNTFFFTIFFVAGCVVLGLFLALLLDQKVAGEGLFRTIFLFPMSLSFIVTGTIWRWMLQPNGGINILPEKLFGFPPLQFSWVNSQEVWLQFAWEDVPRYLVFIGIAILAFLVVNSAAKINLFNPSRREKPKQRFVQLCIFAIIIMLLGLMSGSWDAIWPDLDQPAIEPIIAPKGFNAALLGIIIAAVWQMSGYTMAMFIAGIRGVPEELREAARVDGCTEIDVYRHIVLPQLNAVVLSAIIILGHISLKIFDLVFAMAGPDNAKTVVPGILVYTKGFRQNAFASASAVAVIMLLLVALVIVPYLWSQLRQRRG